jgi:hypothetical protein
MEDRSNAAFDAERVGFVQESPVAVHRSAAREPRSAVRSRPIAEGLHRAGMMISALDAPDFDIAAL